MKVRNCFCFSTLPEGCPSGQAYLELKILWRTGSNFNPLMILLLSYLVSDFEAISRRTETFSTHFEKAKLSANRNRMRRVPSREHLQMKSSGKVGHELAPVKLEVVEEERSHLSVSNSVTMLPFQHFDIK